MRSFIFWSALLGSVKSQLNAGTPGISAGNTAFNGSVLCGKSFASANATGVITIQPNLGIGGPDTVSWGGTLAQGNTNYNNDSSSGNATELSLWFSTNGANYTDNFQLGYDACYLWVGGSTINSILRGQSDDGTCYQMYDEACVNDLKSLTDSYSEQLVGVPSPQPNSNLTTDSLPDVCVKLATMLTENFPSSCNPFFNESRAVFGSPPWLGGPLTGPQSLVSRSKCTTSNGSYSLMWTQYGDANAYIFAAASYFIAPLITAFMPIADATRPVSLAYTRSFMSCLRAKDLNPGTEEIPPAPAPTPIDTDDTSSSNGTAAAVSSQAASPNDTRPHNGGGLSTGAIAGLSVGVILGVSLLFGLAFLFRTRAAELLKNRKRRKHDIPELDNMTEYREMWADSTKLVEAPNNTISSEMSAVSIRRVELEGSEKMAPVELSAIERGRDDDDVWKGGHS